MFCRSLSEGMTSEGSCAEVTTHGLLAEDDIMICPRVLGWSGRDNGSAPSLIISIPPEITTCFSCTSKIEIVHNYCIFYF